MTTRTYEARGVSPDKPDVRKAVSSIATGLFPGAFCKAIPDLLTGSPTHCVLLHADGVGTKSALAYLHYKRHGDPTIFRGLAQDCLAMNLDDLLCVGATGPYIVSNTIGRNAKLIPSEVLKEVIAGYEEVIARLNEHGVNIVSCGGETADVGDIVRTITLDATVATRMPRDEFIDCSKVRIGDAIVGLASFGTTTYEDRENSGIGTNGFTSARHEVLKEFYKSEYPETFAPEIADLAYVGKHDIDDPLPDSGWTVGEALLCPTRLYAPVVISILRKHRRHISALFQNTGGGLTKCLGFGPSVRYEKTDLFELPPVFRFIRDVSGFPLREMVRVFNMGQRMEIVCDPLLADEIIAISGEFNLPAKVIGKVSRCESGRSVVVVMDGEEVEFTSNQ